MTRAIQQNFHHGHPFAHGKIDPRTAGALGGRPRGILIRSAGDSSEYIPCGEDVTDAKGNVRCLRPGTNWYAIRQLHGVKERNARAVRP